MSTMLQERVLVRSEVDDGVAVVTLDSPPLNALDDGLLERLAAVLARLREGGAARVVVLTSAGRKAFAVGLDVPDLATALSAPDPGPLQSPAADRAFKLLWALPQPVIAALPASAVGAGLQLAMSCDLVVAVESATFGMPEVRLGVAPALPGVKGLVRRLGLPRATEMVLLGRTISAARAKELGLISEVVPPGKALDRAGEIARELASLPAGGLQAAKAALRAGMQP
jgi:enoyl-CoA hydratase/carnithine racemase